MQIRFPGVTCVVCGRALPPGSAAEVHPTLRGPQGGKKYYHAEHGAQGNPALGGGEPRRWAPVAPRFRHLAASIRDKMQVHQYDFDAAWDDAFAVCDEGQAFEASLPHKATEADWDRATDMVKKEIARQEARGTARQLKVGKRRRYQKTRRSRRNPHGEEQLPEHDAAEKMALKEYRKRHPMSAAEWRNFKFALEKGAEDPELSQLYNKYWAQQVGFYDDEDY